MTRYDETNRQFDGAMALCRDIFARKLNDYGPSWRMMRPESITDQIYIKAKRIRSLEIKKEAMIDEGILPEFIAIVNYGLVGLIQLDCGFADDIDITAERALELYDEETVGEQEVSHNAQMVGQKRDPGAEGLACSVYGDLSGGSRDFGEGASQEISKAHAEGGEG